LGWGGWWSIHGISRYKFVPKGETVTQHFYSDILWRLWEDVQRKWPEKWRTWHWFLHHDRTPIQFALSVQKFLTNKGAIVVLHPPPLTPQIRHSATSFFSWNSSWHCRKKFWWHRHDSKTTAGYIYRVQNTGLLKMFSTTARKPGSLYQVAGELLRKWQREVAGKYYVRKKKMQSTNLLLTHRKNHEAPHYEVLPALFNKVTCGNRLGDTPAWIIVYKAKIKHFELWSTTDKLSAQRIYEEYL
jgi:hypothetical protein